MHNNDVRLLLSTEDRVISEDIQRILEEADIYTLLCSDNPASSYLSAYIGLNPAEGIDIQINQNDYPRAIEILLDSPYRELVENT